MANATSVADLKADVLTRAGESTDGSSAFDARVLTWLNRAYLELWFITPWPWTIKDPPTVINTVASITNRLVTATINSVAISFDAVIADSVADRKIVIGQSWYRVATHTAGTSTATLRSTFQEASVASVACRIFQDEFELTDADFARIARIYDVYESTWITPVGRDDAYVMRQLTAPTQGAPSRFAMLTDNRLILDADPQRASRLEVHYQFFPPDLTVGGNDPIWPRWRRWVLEDRALSLLFADKNDDRLAVADALWQRTVEEMREEYGSQTPARGYVRNVDVII